MGRKSVVVTPPPAPRKAVVIRRGPPTQKGRILDGIIGLIGLMLIIGSVLLVDVLPDEEVIVPEWRISFAEESGNERPTESIDFIEAGRTQSVAYSFDHDNIYSVRVTVEFQDDIPSSEPDAFEVALYGPDGQVDETVAVVTPPGRLRDAANQTSGQSYEAVRGTADFAFQVTERPPPQVVAATSASESLEEAEARVLPEYLLDTSGEWRVEVTLASAGGCPQAGTEPELTLRAAACNQSTGGTGQDEGNPFSVAKVQYFYYVPNVEPV